MYCIRGNTLSGAGIGRAAGDASFPLYKTHGHTGHSWRRGNRGTSAEVVCRGYGGRQLRRLLRQPRRRAFSAWHGSLPAIRESRVHGRTDQVTPELRAAEGNPSLCRLRQFLDVRASGNNRQQCKDLLYPGRRNKFPFRTIRPKQPLYLPGTPRPRSGAQRHRGLRGSVSDQYAIPDCVTGLFGVGWCFYEGGTLCPGGIPAGSQRKPVPGRPADADIADDPACDRQAPCRQRRIFNRQGAPDRFPG